MRWRAKQCGDTRIKTIFPIIPIYMDGIWYWFEKIKILQQYESIYDGEYSSCIWVNIKIIDKEC